MKNCFTGTDAVDWLTKTLLISRAEAVLVGESLMHRGLFHHVHFTTTFKDNPQCLYQFSTEINNSSNTNINSSGESNIKSPRSPRNTMNRFDTSSVINDSNIFEIVETMIKELSKQDLTVNDEVLKGCFKGKDAITWLQQHLKLPSRIFAIDCGQLLINRGLMHHVEFCEPFGDNEEFYRFYKVSKIFFSFFLFFI
jgi:hypothetical protein